MVLAGRHKDCLLASLDSSACVWWRKSAALFQLERAWRREGAHPDRSPVRPYTPSAAKGSTNARHHSMGSPLSSWPAYSISCLPQARQLYLSGQHAGRASIAILENTDNTRIEMVSVVYHNFSDDGRTFLNGTQAVNATTEHITSNRLHWYSQLIQSAPNGEAKGWQVTSDGGFHMSIDVVTNDFEANGTLDTTIDGWTFVQPRNGR